MITITDYGVGNLFSVEKAFRALGADVITTNDENEVLSADKLVLPGVGAFGDCIKNLDASGLIPALKNKLDAGTPLLGICVGLQILFDESEESPGAIGLGLIRGKVRKICADGLKIPHMGWNSLDFQGGMQIFENLPQNPYVYFVHSYHAVPDDTALVIATAEYGEKITAAVKANNITAAQFHPEKSGDVGLTILKNFISTAN